MTVLEAEGSKRETRMGAGDAGDVEHKVSGGEVSGGRSWILHKLVSVLLRPDGMSRTGQGPLFKGTGRTSRTSRSGRERGARESRKDVETRDQGVIYSVSTGVTAPYSRFAFMRLAGICRSGIAGGAASVRFNARALLADREREESTAQASYVLVHLQKLYMRGYD